MILKEFDLDLPYIKEEELINKIMAERKIEYFDATKYDYEKNWKGKRNRFRTETRCITALFERLHEKLTTDNCWKILVEIVTEITQKNMKETSGLYIVQVKYNYDIFEKYSDYEKKKETLEILFEGIKKITKQKGWSIASFEKVYKQIIELNYENTYIWKKQLKNRNGKLSAEIFCEHTIQKFSAYLCVRDLNNKIIVKEHLFDEIPDEFFFSEKLGKIKWVSENKICLISKEDEIVKEIVIPNY